MEYRESQKFNQWWLWLLNFGLLGFVGWAAYQEYLGGLPWWQAALGVMAVLVVALVPMALITLQTTITEDGVEVKFWPFSRRRIFRSEIRSMHVREYSPIGEYGGWGVKSGPNGKAYNMMGNQGLQLELTDGKKILIGTQRPEELAAFLDTYFAEHDVLTDEAITLQLKELRKDPLER